MATILIADDQATNRQFLRTLLGYKGHAIVEAEDGVQALEGARKARPDLIIADILMPTMDGYEFVRRLRAEPALATTPVVFYSAIYHEREARALAEACGVRHLITKPSDPEVVLETIEQALAVGTADTQAGPDADFERRHSRLLSDKLAASMEELRAANSRLRALIDIGQQVAAERDPERLLERFCPAARDIMGARCAGVALCGEDGELRRVWVERPDAESMPCMLDAVPRLSCVAQVLASRAPLRRREEIEPPCRCCLGVPMSSPTEVRGVLFFLNKIGADEFSAEDEHLALTLGAQAAVAYENALYYERLQAHARQLEDEVAERRLIEKSLRESEEKFAQAFHGMPHWMTISTLADGRLLEVNDAFTRLTGFTREEVLGRTADELALWAEMADRAEVIAELARSGHMRDRELRFRTKSGEIRLGRLAAERIELAGNTCMLSVVQDVTEQKRLEEQLRQAQKLESIGLLAGGIAHDFNNLLTAMIGNVSLLLETAELKQNDRSLLDSALWAAERAAMLTRQLLAYAGKGSAQVSSVNLSELARETENFLRTSVPKSVLLEWELDPEPPPVRADAGQLQQILMNLVLNAGEAIGEKEGRIVLRTGSREKHDGQPGEPPRTYAFLQVRDNGCGMDERTRARIFEPFFTTKFFGRGLGLAAVYGIVQQLQGEIEISSLPGAGTSFTVLLPAATADEPAAPPDGREAEQNLRLKRGSGTILLVDDEPFVRRTARAALERAGYNVLEAANGREALAIFRGLQDCIALVLLDLSMPQMNGSDTYEELIRIRPEVRVLLASGYSEEESLKRFPRHVYFIQKPYSAAALAARIGSILRLAAVDSAAAACDTPGA